METFLRVLSKKSLNERIKVIAKILNEAPVNSSATREKNNHEGAELEQIGNDTYVWWKEGGKGYLKIFGPKSPWQKKFYGYRSDSELNKALDTYRKMNADSTERKAGYKDEKSKKKTMMGQLVYEGDIFYHSWGYDQTNIEFYEVTKKISNDTLEVRELKQKTSDHGSGGYQNVAAIPGSYVGPAHKVRVTPYGISLAAFGFKSDHGYPWDGKPTYSTAAGWGH